jgi:SAM-dependent methyltransferase
MPLSAKATAAQLAKWTDFFAVGFMPWDTQRPASQLVAFLAHSERGRAGGDHDHEDSPAASPATPAAARASASDTRSRDHPIRRVVELGCGMGASTHWLSTKVDVAVGVDLVHGTIDAARAAAAASGSRATFVCGDIFALPIEELPPASFDLVFDCQCFHCTYFVDAKKAVAAIASLLRPGGLFLCLTGNDTEPEVGPAVLSRAQIESAFEDSGLFDIVYLREGRFDPTPAYAKLQRLPLCWELLARRKPPPAI